MQRTAQSVVRVFGCAFIMHDSPFICSSGALKSITVPDLKALQVSLQTTQQASTCARRKQDEVSGTQLGCFVWGEKNENQISEEGV